MEKVRIAIGSDHGGFHLKEDIKKYLEELGARKINIRDTFHRVLPLWLLHFL